jgi:hypothetical protein
MAEGLGLLSPACDRGSSKKKKKELPIGMVGTNLTTCQPYLGAAAGLSSDKC